MTRYEEAKLDMVFQTMNVLDWNLPSVIFWAYFYAERRASVKRVQREMLELENHGTVSDVVCDFCLDVLSNRNRPNKLQKRLAAVMPEPVTEMEVDDYPTWESDGYFYDEEDK